MKTIKSILATAYPLLIWSFLSVDVLSHQVIAPSGATALPAGFAMDGQSSPFWNGGEQELRKEINLTGRRPAVWNIQEQERSIPLSTEKLFLSRSPNFVPCSDLYRSESVNGWLSGQTCTVQV